MRSNRARAIFNKLLGAAFALVLVFSFLPTAHAEEARILITASPTELPDAGNVTFTFEINNYNSDYPMTDIMINYNGADYNVLQGVVIAPSSQIKNISLTLPVSQSQLGKPITFVFTWNRNGEPMQQDVQYTIAQAENPIISVTRTADKTNAKPGDKVVVTYTIKNTTKFDMTDIMLIDENISDIPIFQNETLRASRTMSYDFTYTMGEESVTSTPLVTYTVNGKAKTFSALEPLELTMVRIQLDLRIQAGTPTSTGVTFTLDVVNSGTQPISNIMITDERANAVNDAAFTLAAGESKSLTYVIVPLMTEPLRNVQFYLIGTDPFGEAYEIKPTQDQIYQVYPYVDASQINVEVRAETITPWTQESGKLSARVTITNHSSVELTDVTISETTIGVIKNYDILPVGETTFDQEIQLGSPRNLTLTLKGYDPTGTNRELASFVMPVAYGTETAAPATPTPTQTEGPKFSIFSGISSGIATILIILGVLMVFSVIVLVALTVMERAHTPRHYLEDEEDDYFEPKTTHQTTRSTYRDTPDQEEIRYTQRMFAQREEEPQAPEPIRLPPAQVRPSDQAPVIFSQPRQQEPNPEPLPQQLQPQYQSQPQSQPQSQQQRADELAQRLVETARTKYSAAQSTANYRPASEMEKQQLTPPTTQQQAGPRVSDYKKQPRQQRLEKPTVTHIQKHPDSNLDDDE